MLGRGATLVTAEEEVEEESPSARIRKKRYLRCLLYVLRLALLIFFSLQNWTARAYRVGAESGGSLGLYCALLLLISCSFENS